MTIEEKLKALILSRYETVAAFADECGVKYTTVMGILSRGVNNANIVNVIKICQELGIGTEELIKGEIVFVNRTEREYIKLENLSSTCDFLLHENYVMLDGVLLSKYEKDFLMDAIEINLELLRRKRIRDKFTEALND